MGGGTHEILQLYDMSKIWPKHGFEPRYPYPKKFFRRVNRALLLEMSCKPTPQLRWTCRKMVEDPSGMSPSATDLEK